MTTIHSTKTRVRGPSFALAPLALVPALLLACGTSPTALPDGGAAAIDLGSGSCGPAATLAVVTTDYSTGGAALIDLDTWTPRVDLTTIHPDAVVRCTCGAAVVIERLGGDNLTLLEPGGLTHLGQHPLGRRTNPQDAWIDGETAYVTLHESGEVAAVALRTGEVKARLDLSPLADEDGQPEPAAIVGHGEHLYVALQLLDRSAALWAPTGPAVLAVLSRGRDLAIAATISLEGRNPVTALRPGFGEGVVLVGHAGSWTDGQDGGIEAIDLEAGRSLGMVIDGQTLGGSIVDFVVVHSALGYASVNVPGEGDLLLSFDPSEGRRLEVVAEGPSYSLVRLLLDGGGHVVVASRDPAAPGLRVFDVEDGSELTSAPIPTGLPPFDLCMLPAPLEGTNDDDGGVTTPDGAPNDPGGPDPFCDGVTSFSPAEGATFGADQLPDVVLGPPEGAGEGAGSLDVVSLGCGGSIVLRFDPPIVDVAGPDFIVFENAFTSTSGLFAEPGQVAVSADGEFFQDFPCEPTVTLEGCAGVTPVSSNSENGIDPTDVGAAGGDPFDLEDLGLSEASYVRIVDRSSELPGSEIWCDGPNAGFDLDAIAAVGWPY